jgi:glycosyltransferase involved in cell wall biosynthesis
MKILHLIDTLEVGGAEKSLLDIYRRFHTTDVVMCHIYPGDRLKSQYEEAGIRVLSLNVQGKYGFPAAIRKVTGVIQREKPDLVHTTLYRSNLIGRILAPRLHLPLINSIVNDSYTPARWKNLSYSGRLKLGIVQWVDRLTAPRVDSFIANSHSVKEGVCSALHIPPAAVHVIHRGRNGHQFARSSSEALAALRAELGFNENQFILLNVARLLQRKGQTELMQAMRQVVNTIPQAHLLIAGEGPFREHLEQLRAGLGLEDHVTLLGYRSDVPALLDIANVFVFPSHYEGHPGALVEAMFSQKPIVASDIEVHRETITDRKTGLLVPCEDMNSIAQAILWLFHHPADAAQLGVQAREEAMARFHIDNIAMQFETYCQELSDAHSSGRSKTATARR